MSQEELRALLWQSLVDFRDALPGVSADVLTALRNELAAQAAVSTAAFAIRAIDGELARRS